MSKAYSYTARIFSTPRTNDNTQLDIVKIANGDINVQMTL